MKLLESCFDVETTQRQFIIHVSGGRPLYKTVHVQTKHRCEAALCKAHLYLFLQEIHC
jgi:hypothetical protein